MPSDAHDKIIINCIRLKIKFVRLVSVSSVFGKVFEIIVHDQF